MTNNKVQKSNLCNHDTNLVEEFFTTNDRKYELCEDCYRKLLNKLPEKISEELTLGLSDWINYTQRLDELEPNRLVQDPITKDLNWTDIANACYELNIDIETTHKILKQLKK